MTDSDTTPLEKDLSALRAGLVDGRLTISSLEDGSGVVLDVVGEQLLTMNATGLAIMQAIERGEEHPEALAAKIGAASGVSAERVLEDLPEFVRKVRLAVRIDID